MEKITPSNLPFSVFVLCPPYYVDDKIKNNIWMAEETEKIDGEKFLGEWYNLYNILSSNALIYLLPSKRGLQDQTYVNSFVCLNDKNTVILSNFVAPGRKGEEM